jgi:Uma2 family endonuclease
MIWLASWIAGPIVQWLIRLFIALRPELFLWTEQGLKVRGYRAGRARPDGVLADAEAFVGCGEWADPDPVLMVVEVTSHDQDTERRDRDEKPRAYAESGIPVYLLIDRQSCEVTAYSEPVDGRYEQRLTVSFGAEIRIPDPVGVSLDTEALKAWVK